MSQCQNASTASLMAERLMVTSPSKPNFAIEAYNTQHWGSAWGKSSTELAQGRRVGGTHREAHKEDEGIQQGNIVAGISEHGICGA